MKNFLPSVSLIASLMVAFPSSANATLLLAGWYDFDSSSASETADQQGFGFSGAALKQAGSIGTSGSNDGFYGNSDIPSSPGNDGYAVADSNFTPRSTTFRVTNISSTEPSIGLWNLFFDAAGLTASSSMNVAYRIGSGSIVNLAPTGALPLRSSGFGSFSRSLIGIPLPAVGQSIDFIFTSVGGTVSFIDNVAITAVPEPASLLALGGLICSGLLLRSRGTRRQTAV